MNKRGTIILVFTLSLSTQGFGQSFELTERGNLRWAVKTNVLSPFIGEFPLSVEYAFRRPYTFEGGLGLLTRNYISSASNGVPLLGGGAGGCNDCDYNLNMSLFGRGRYFFSGCAYDGGYVGMLVHYKPFDGSLTKQGVTSEFSEVASELGFFFGSQSTHADWLLIDYYFGASIRSIDYDRPFFDLTGQEVQVFRETKSETGMGLFFSVMLGYVLD